MSKRKKERPWELKVTWTLSLVMLLLVFGFFYQSFEEMLQIAPVQVAVERLSGPDSPDESDGDARP
jgi:hypothetical protein